MMTRWWVPALSVLLIASGCATGDSLESTGPRITYAQLKATTETYRGQTVTLGGKILSAKRLKEETRIEILQLPLVSSLKPTLELSASQGRFVATKKEFLDPATKGNSWAKYDQIVAACEKYGLRIVARRNVEREPELHRGRGTHGEVSGLGGAPRWCRQDDLLREAA